MLGIVNRVVSKQQQQHAPVELTGLFEFDQMVLDNFTKSCKHIQLRFAGRDYTR